jgi:hypothetical protein
VDYRNALVARLINTKRRGLQSCPLPPDVVNVGLDERKSHVNVAHGSQSQDFARQTLKGLAKLRPVNGAEKSLL